jgi:hypothetical protein
LDPVERVVILEHLVRLVPPVALVLWVTVHPARTEDKVCVDTLERQERMECPVRAGTMDHLVKMAKTVKTELVALVVILEPMAKMELADTLERVEHPEHPEQLERLARMVLVVITDHLARMVELALPVLLARMVLAEQEGILEQPAKTVKTEKTRNRIKISWQNC